jgi:hypothetical protein
MRVQIRLATSFVLTLLLLLSTVPLTLAVPDEGMYMLDQIANLPLKDRGARIKASDIYNPAGGGLSDAIVRVNIGAGGFGTGEFLSANGLLLTNHHVGFDALVASSTKEKDYATNGYTSTSMATELPAEGYSVMITQRSENVTAKILDGVPAADPERKAEIDKRVADLQKTEAAKAPASTVRVLALNNGFFYYLFQTMEVKDIRIVYAPPKNIGFFGGDPDNFEWTRHCGDFTFMRAYVAPDGSSAAYSPNNVPYKPKKYLNVSLGGVKDNDFTMVLGYPGGTNRYREHESVEYNQNVRIPLLVRYFQAEISALRAEGAQDPEKKIKLQSDIFSFANSEKAFDGGVFAMRRAGLLEKKKTGEKNFDTWVNSDPARKAKYGEVLSSFSRLYGEFNKYAQKNLVVNLMSGATPVFQVAASGRLGKPHTPQELEQFKAGMTEALKNRNLIAETEMVKFFLREAADLPAGQKIDGIETAFGSLEGAARVRAEENYARAVMENKQYNTLQGLTEFYSMTAEQAAQLKDPVLAALMTEFPQAQARGAKFNGEIAKWRELYLEGWSDMSGKKPYPDANATIRFSFGNIKGYIPKESVIYTPFTTLGGVVEKDTGVEPFNVPQKLKDLYQSKDFGRYAGLGSVPVNFLTTNDIIGGNSGSPVLNGSGEQVGIVFDGNYEGLGNDFFFSDALGRTIAVDIRYVFFVTEKFGGVNWFFPEINITGAPKEKNRG